MLRHSVFAATCALPIASAAAQLQWRLPDGPFQLTPRFGVQLADDAARARVVLFGGNDYSYFRDETWEWDGLSWGQRFPATRPPARSYYGLAYDGVRGRTVLFGGAGASNTTLGDLWEWDGTNWTQLAATGGPAPRRGVAMGYDLSRAHVVLFGGTLANNALATDPHWEWDGTSWTLGPTGPLPRANACLAYDALRGRTVLFGGGGTCLAFTCPTFGDTWEFDGTAWSQRASTGPSARQSAAMTYDLQRNRVLLVGGQGGCMPACVTTHNDAWEWDGTAWSLRSTSGPRHHSLGLTYDLARGTAVTFGGIHGDPQLANLPGADTFGFDGTNWSTLAPAAAPPVRRSHAIEYDAARARVVFFGNAASGNPGRAETWEWNGGTWSQRTPPVSPPPRDQHTLAYDSARQRLVLFGGSSASGSFLNDTWEWDGATWAQATTPASPPPQYAHAMAYDSVRQRTVLFPGAFGQNQHWEYDGAVWTQVPTAAMPPYRLNAGLAFDRRRARTVLFGGINNSFANDTWEWDGTNWTEVLPPQRPPGRNGGRLVFDSVRGRTVLFGGASATWAPLQDTWEFDGATWTQRTFAQSPPGRMLAGLAYDSGRARTVMLGGHGAPGGSWMQDTWELLSPCDRFGPGEVAGGGLALGCSTPPQLGTSFCVSYSNPSPQAAGVQFLLLAPGACSAPSVMSPPTTCAPSWLYAAPTAVLLATGNPTTFCLALPNNPAFVGTPLCLQGASLENAGCLRATDALSVVAQ